jgi:hypothetical protein
MIQTCIITPFKDEPETTIRYLSLLKNEEFDICFLYDNGSTEENRIKIKDSISDDRIHYISAFGWGIHEMWNHGWELANQHQHPVNVAFFNNDIEWDEPIVGIMSERLRSQPGIGCVYTDYHSDYTGPLHSLVSTFGTFKDGGMAGFAFMLRGELAPSRVPYFDTNFKWWCGDDFIEMMIRRAGMQVCRINGLRILHHQEKTANNGCNEWTHAAKGHDLRYFEENYLTEYLSLSTF